MALTRRPASRTSGLSAKAGALKWMRSVKSARREASKAACSARAAAKSYTRAEFDQVRQQAERVASAVPQRRASRVFIRVTDRLCWQWQDRRMRTLSAAARSA